MAASTTSDYSTTRPPLRARTTAGGLVGASASPRSPRTPILGRSVSSQFGSPGNSFRAEQEELIVYELGARHLSAGFAGESRPRCVVRWAPDMGRRVGDYRSYQATGAPTQKRSDADSWGGNHEFYRIDTRAIDLELVQDKLERTVRNIHVEFLQLDPKPRKAVLAIPSLLPTPLAEIMLNVLFNHFAQPPVVTILTTPMLACVGAGQRNALIVDVGWEETVVTAIGEYKQVHQRRSVRAGKMLTLEMARLLEEEAKTSVNASDVLVDFETAEDLTERVAWCRRMGSDNVRNDEFHVPLRGAPTLVLPFYKLSDPAEKVLFSATSSAQDDHELPLPSLAYRVLLALPLDLRALAVSRIIITGGVSQLPGLKHRLLQEMSHLLSTRGWNPVESYGSATPHRKRVLRERNANLTLRPKTDESENPSSPIKPAIQYIQHGERLPDDVRDPTSMKAEHRMVDSSAKKETVKGVVRGLETVGAWSSASLIASLRVNGVHEVNREDFLKHGIKDVLI